MELLQLYWSEIFTITFLSSWIFLFIQNRNYRKDKKSINTLLDSTATHKAESIILKEIMEKNRLHIEDLEKTVFTEQERNRVILSQKKSSETRLGQIGEQLVPFLSGCPYDPKNLHFLAAPIDYIAFDYDQGEIVFLEIKTGNSKPSKRQKLIKNIIRAGKVYYADIRINEKGVKHTKAENFD